jgi:hypothetical protein
MKRITSVSVLAASVFMLSSTVALAAEPTQADFDACNQMAQSTAQSPVSPSASPETKQPMVPPTASSSQAAPSDKSSAQSPVSPSASSETKQPTVPPSASATQAAPSDKTAAEARVENQANQLRGITDASKDDARYKQAYRDCMKGRGF